MLRHKNTLIFLLTFLMIFLLFIFWQLSTYAGKFYFYEALKINGETDNLEIMDKGILIGKDFQSTDEFTANANHQFKFNVFMANGTVKTCQTNVTANEFKSHKKGDSMALTYLPYKPVYCSLAASVNSSYKIYLRAILTMLTLLGLLLGFVILASRLFKTPKFGQPNKST
jgi:hypothetical protein